MYLFHGVSRSEQIKFLLDFCSVNAVVLSPLPDSLVFVIKMIFFFQVSGFVSCVFGSFEKRLFSLLLCF